jgi:hypothetical protein
VRARLVRWAAAAALLAGLAPPPALAFEFVSPERLGAAGIVWPDKDDGSGLLEAGPPAEQPQLAIGATHTQWFGLRQLASRSLTLAAGRRGWRAAAGVAATGDADLGWRTLAAGGGVANVSGGAGLCARARDEPSSARQIAVGGSPFRGAEYSAGGGAWVRAAPGLRLSAGAARLWSSAGASLPEDAPQASLHLGEGALVAAGACRQDGRGHREWALALRVAAPPLRIYTGAYGAPLRTTFALAWEGAGVWVAGAAELHPVLGTTTSAALRWRW